MIQNTAGNKYNLNPTLNNYQHNKRVKQEYSRRGVYFHKLHIIPQFCLKKKGRLYKPYHYKLFAFFNMLVRPLEGVNEWLLSN